MTKLQSGGDRFLESVPHTASTSLDTFTGNPDTLLSLALRCPQCHTRFPDVGGRPIRMTCSGCGFLMVEQDGIVRALAPHSKASFEQFVHDYKAVRAKEGWGSPAPDYYLALPFEDATNRHTWIWRIRAQTLLYMLKRILPKVDEQDYRILDIGAGNGWLSYRLAQRGYHPVAVDLLDDKIDGLGAARHYFPHLPRPFLRFQADMNHLPFELGQFDVAIFNASFHYSSDAETTVREVIRCMRRPGLVIIADSPLYTHNESGQMMLEERRTTFEKDFGIRSDEKQHLEYLTPQILSELAEKLSIRWNVGKPWYGLSWAMRPMKARLLGRREPSKFHLWWFTLPQQLQARAK